MRLASLSSRSLRTFAIFTGLAAALLVLGTSGALSAQQAPAAQARPFTATERSTLENGGLVVRRKSERRGNQILLGGTSWQVVMLPPEAVWRAVLDVPQYTRMLPNCTASRTVERFDDRRTVFLAHQGGPVRASYYLNTRAHEDRHDLTFVLDARRPHAIRAAWGFFTVRPYGDGKSLLSYGVMADYGDGFLSGVLRGRLQDWSLLVPQTVRQYVEGAGRGRYFPSERLRGAPGLAREERALGRAALVGAALPSGRALVVPHSAATGVVAVVAGSEGATEPASLR